MSGSVDWRGALLDAVRQVFVRERSVLKSALYSQLDLLDTSDAIIHLNQLERRLAEQVNNNQMSLIKITPHWLQMCFKRAASLTVWLFVAVCVIQKQDAQHREAMGSVHTAERASFISEIHQLRGQLEQLHQGQKRFKCCLFK